MIILMYVVLGLYGLADLWNIWDYFHPTPLVPVSIIQELKQNLALFEFPCIVVYMCLCFLPACQSLTTTPQDREKSRKQHYFHLLAAVVFSIWAFFHLKAVWIFFARDGYKDAGYWGWMASRALAILISTIVAFDLIKATPDQVAQAARKVKRAYFDHQE